MSTSTDTFQPVEQGATLWSIFVDERRENYESPPELYVHEVTRTVAKVTPQRLKWAEDEGERFRATVHRAKPNDLGFVGSVQTYGAGGRFYASREQAIDAMLDAHRTRVARCEQELDVALARQAVARSVEGPGA